MYSLILMFGLLIGFSVSLPAAEEPAKPASDFFRKYPTYREFFPFGVYSGGRNLGYSSCNLYYMDEERGTQFTLEGLREHYLNFLWSGDLCNMMEKNGQYVPDDPFATDLAWLRKLDMYLLLMMSKWFSTKNAYGEVFADLKGKNVSLTDDQIKKYVEKHKSKFEAVSELERQMGDRLLGIVTDDEPGGVLQTYLSSARAVKQFIPGKPVTTVVGGGPVLYVFAPHLELLCTESYGRSKWGTRDSMLKVYELSPNNVLWNDVLTVTYTLESTLPDMPDDRITPGQLRLSLWQSLAGGVKGFMCYLERLQPTWWPGDNSYRNEFGREIKGNAFGVMRDFGRDITAIGPLLLSCRPVSNEIAQIQFQSGRVEYLAYQGPALDGGVLLEQGDALRRYIVVYNNNIDGDEKGAMSLPEAWLKDKAIYNLHTLKQLSGGSNGTTFAVDTLLPGDGRIYLVAGEEGFQKSKREILRHRVKNELVQLDIRIRELEPFLVNGTESYVKELRAKLPEIQKERKALDAAAASTTADPEAAWNKLQQLLKETDQLKKTGLLKQINAYFREIEDRVNDIEELISCFSFELFKKREGDRYDNRGVTENEQLMAAYRDLIIKYFADKQLYWRGLADSELVYRLKCHARDAGDVLGQYRKTVDQALQIQRRPIKVLYLTPKVADSQAVEFSETYAWLYKNFIAEYGSVQADSTLANRAGTALRLEDYDVLWFHQTRVGKVNKDKAVCVEDVFEPGLLRKEFLDLVRKHISGGKSVLLSGLSALYVVPLGYEQVMPNRFQSEGSMDMPVLRGFCAAPGYARHPLFKGDNTNAILLDAQSTARALGQNRECDPRGRGTEFRYDPAGFYTSGHWKNTEGDFAECTWQKTNTQGRVIAAVYDSVLGPLDDYAGIVEYGGVNGQGKILIGGSMPFDFSPGLSFNPQFDPRWKFALRGLVYNMLCYLGGGASYAMDKDAAAKTGTRKQKDMTYLPVQWKFRLDPENKGKDGKWYSTDLDESQWQDINIGASWESQGFDYDGYAWYRVRFKVSETFKGKKVLLNFGAVDEEAQVYLDGNFVGKGWPPVGDDRLGWSKPFSLDITSNLTDYAKDYQLTVQVYDSMAAGGIWRPICLVSEEAGK